MIASAQLNARRKDKKNPDLPLATPRMTFIAIKRSERSKFRFKSGAQKAGHQ
jgi:hypothetical protein